MKKKNWSVWLMLMVMTFMVISGGCGGGGGGDVVPENPINPINPDPDPIPNPDPTSPDPFVGTWVAVFGNCYDSTENSGAALSSGQITIENLSSTQNTRTEAITGRVDFADGNGLYWNRDEHTYTYTILSDTLIEYVGPFESRGTVFTSRREFELVDADTLRFSLNVLNSLEEITYEVTFRRGNPNPAPDPFIGTWVAESGKRGIVTDGVISRETILSSGQFTIENISSTQNTRTEAIIGRVDFADGGWSEYSRQNPKSFTILSDTEMKYEGHYNWNNTPIPATITLELIDADTLGYTLGSYEVIESVVFRRGNPAPNPNPDPDPIPNPDPFEGTWDGVRGELFHNRPDNSIGTVLASFSDGQITIENVSNTQNTRTEVIGGRIDFDNGDSFILNDYTYTCTILDDDDGEQLMVYDVGTYVRNGTVFTASGRFFFIGDTLVFQINNDVTGGFLFQVDFRRQ